MDAEGAVWEAGEDKVRAVGMENTEILTPDEEKLLTALGYVVMRWNYAENFARMILRQYRSGNSLHDQEHMSLSQQNAGWIETELKKKALPQYEEPGRKFLERLIDAYSSARKHRNNIVHGIHSTIEAMGEYPAQAILIPGKLKNGKYYFPPAIDLKILQETAHHFHDLAMFAREVYLTFNQDGSVACNKDGSPVMPVFPTMVSHLPEIELIPMKR